VKPFELMVVVKPGLDDAALAACRERVAGWVAESGGRLEEVFDVGEIQLASEIKKQSRGRFLLFWLEGPGDLPAAVARRVRVDEEILRHLIVDRAATALKTIRTTVEEKERGDGKRS